MFWHLGEHKVGNDDLAAAKGVSKRKPSRRLRLETQLVNVHKAVEKVEVKLWTLARTCRI
jgi:hypothetical protein